MVAAPVNHHEVIIGIGSQLATTRVATETTMGIEETTEVNMREEETATETLLLGGKEVGADRLLPLSRNLRKINHEEAKATTMTTPQKITQHTTQKMIIVLHLLPG